jgi:hypothetical protein
MTGAHDSNFTLKELALRLGHGMDIVRVFADHPEWYLAHQRMSTTRGGKANHLSPRDWKGNAIVANVNLLQVWIKGSSSASASIAGVTHIPGHTPVLIDWTQHWSSRLDSDILRPCDSHYPAVKAGSSPTDNASDSGNSKDRSSDEDTEDLDQVFSQIPLEERGAAITSVLSARAHIPTPEPECSSSQQASSNAAIQDGNMEQDWVQTAADDAVNDQSSSEPLGPATDGRTHALRRARSVWMDGRWIHIESLFRICFNEDLPGQSHDRLKRVRSFIPPSVHAHLQNVDRSDAVFLVGDCVLTIIRHDLGAYLAIVQATHLYKSGKLVYSICKDDVSLAIADIEIRGQLLCFSPRCHPGSGSLLWDWTHRFAAFRPVRDTLTARDLRDVRIAAGNSIPTNLPISSTGEATETTWAIPHEQLEAARAMIWSRIAGQADQLSKLPVCGISADFPYRRPDGTCTRPDRCRADNSPHSNRFIRLSYPRLYTTSQRRSTSVLTLSRERACPSAPSTYVWTYSSCHSRCS